MWHTVEKITVSAVTGENDDPPEPCVMLHIQLDDGRVAEADFQLDAASHFAEQIQKAVRDLSAGRRAVASN